MARPKQHRDPSLRHPGVQIHCPQPQHGRPCWRLSIRDPYTGKRKYTPLAWATSAINDKRRVLQAAHDLSIEIARTAATLPGTPSAQTLLAEAERFIAAGKLRGRERGTAYSRHSVRLIRDAVASLNTFALGLGLRAGMHDGQPSVELEALKSAVRGQSVLLLWRQHERDRSAHGGDAPRLENSVMASVKWVHAVLKRAVYSADSKPVFDGAALRMTIPVYSVRPQDAPRAIPPAALARLLQAAMSLDDEHRLLSADLAFLLLATMRRFEAVMLRCRHVITDHPVKHQPAARGLVIALPAWLDGQPRISHAKNAEARIVGFGYRPGPSEPYSGMSPLGAELVHALAHGRQRSEWLLSHSYQALPDALARCSTLAELPERVTPHMLRTTSANHVRELIGKDRAVKRNGHTEQVFDTAYEDAEYELDLMQRPASLEASLGIATELRAIIARVYEHPRGWGYGERPLPHSAERYLSSK